MYRLFVIFVIKRFLYVFCFLSVDKAAIKPAKARKKYKSLHEKICTYKSLRGITRKPRRYIRAYIRSAVPRRVKGF